MSKTIPRCEILNVCACVHERARACVCACGIERKFVHAAEVMVHCFIYFIYFVFILTLLGVTISSAALPFQRPKCE